MGKWKLCKITIEAELEGRLETLVLGPEALEHKYIGLGWGNIRKEGSYKDFHIFDPRIFNVEDPTGTPSTPNPAPLPVMSRPSPEDQPALLLKEPNCCVDLWP
ncbi:MAG: hypothetical protein KGN80_07865 [Acidobacteriota bacterium]|nr:hypothetical protein [Acidobacteriota bacterium]